jgi:hypothetical protein
MAVLIPSAAQLLALLISGLVGISATAFAQRTPENIESIAAESDRLMQGKPVQFRHKRSNVNGEKLIQYGLIAEEVAEEHAQNQGHTHQLTAQERLIHDQGEQIAKLQSRAAELESLKARLVELERVTAQLARMNGGDGERNP